MKKTNLQILQETRELLSNEKRWTKGAVARDADGLYVSVFSEHAVCFCFAGALSKVRGLPDFPPHSVELTMPTGFIFVSQANDSITHAELMEWIDRAIALEAK